MYIALNYTWFVSNEKKLLKTYKEVLDINWYQCYSNNNLNKPKRTMVYYKQIYFNMEVLLV